MEVIQTTKNDQPDFIPSAISKKFADVPKSGFAYKL